MMKVNDFNMTHTKEKRAAYMREYRKTHPEYRKKLAEYHNKFKERNPTYYSEYNRKYRMAHPEYVAKQKECRKTFKEKNPEYFQKYSRKYREKNREECNKKSREWKATHREAVNAANYSWYKKHPEVKKAHTAARYLELKKQCEDCGTTENLEHHHPDYSKPREVITLCKNCHKRRHSTNRGEIYTKVKCAHINSVW